MPPITRRQRQRQRQRQSPSTSPLPRTKSAKNTRASPIPSINSRDHDSDTSIDIDTLITRTNAYFDHRSSTGGKFGHFGQFFEYFLDLQLNPVLLKKEEGNEKEQREKIEVDLISNRHQPPPSTSESRSNTHAGPSKSRNTVKITKSSPRCDHNIYKIAWIVWVTHVVRRSEDDNENVKEREWAKKQKELWIASEKSKSESESESEATSGNAHISGSGSKPVNTDDDGHLLPTYDGEVDSENSSGSLRQTRGGKIAKRRSRGKGSRGKKAGKWKGKGKGKWKGKGKEKDLGMKQVMGTSKEKAKLLESSSNSNIDSVSHGYTPFVSAQTSFQSSTQPENEFKPEPINYISSVGTGINSILPSASFVESASSRSHSPPLSISSLSQPASLSSTPSDSSSHQSSLTPGPLHPHLNHLHTHLTTLHSSITAIQQTPLSNVPEELRRVAGLVQTLREQVGKLIVLDELWLEARGGSRW